jgi:hypothetical protein
LVSLIRILIDFLFGLGLAYEYNHTEPGFSVPRSQAIGVYSQSPVELPASATMRGDHDSISQPLSPFSFPSTTTGNLFFYRLAFSYLGILVLALIRVYFYFPAHEVLSSEIARVDILADPPASTDVVSSGFCTDSPSQVYMHPFSVLLAGIYLCYLLTHRFDRL